MITNHDASMFPSLNINGSRLVFDRILCDVPCSGDGTLRKNGGIWRDWNPANGIGLHGSVPMALLLMLMMQRGSEQFSAFLL